MFWKPRLYWTKIVIAQTPHRQRHTNTSQQPSTPIVGWQNPTLSATTSSQANEYGPKRNCEFDSTWLQLKLKGAATPPKHKTCGLGIQFDSHRPLQKAVDAVGLTDFPTLNSPGESHICDAVERGVVRLRAFWTRTEAEFTLRLVVHYFIQNQDPERS